MLVKGATDYISRIKNQVVWQYLWTIDCAIGRHQKSDRCRMPHHVTWKPFQNACEPLNLGVLHPWIKWTSFNVWVRFFLVRNSTQKLIRALKWIFIRCFSHQMYDIVKFHYRYVFHYRYGISSNGNIFRVIALCAGNSPVTGEFPAKASDTELWCFLWSALEQTVE